MDGIGIIAAFGGLLLALVLLYAMLRNRRRSRADVQRTEEATKDLYANVDRQDRISDYERG